MMSLPLLLRSSIPFLFFIFFLPSISSSPLSNNDHPSSSSTSSSSSSSSSSSFWLSSDLISVQFRKGCVSTALCHQPAFKLVHTMTLNGETAQMSWPVNGAGGAELIQDAPRQFVSHWSVGDPEDVSIGCQIAGTDPSFGFARVCDEAPARRVFQEAMVRRTVMTNNNKNQHRFRRGGKSFDGAPSSSASSLADDDGAIVDGDQQAVVELRGRCFNATLVVRKHTRRCPWCPDPNLHIDVAAAGATGDAAGQQPQHAEAEGQSALLLQNILILALSGAVVFAVTGLSAVLVVQRRGRKRHSKGGGKMMMGKGGGIGQKPKKKRMMTIGGGREQRSGMPPVVSPRMMRREVAAEEPMIIYGGGSRTVEPLEGTTTVTEQEETERYDTPWDNKYCLVPRHWLFTNNPPGATSSIRGPPSAVLPRHPPPPPLLPPHHLPPPHPSSFRDSSSKYATCSDFGRSHQPPMMGGLAMPGGLPDHPPPALPSARHSHPSKVPDHHHPAPSHTFASPNTSADSAISNNRQDDSGLDSV